MIAFLDAQTDKILGYLDNDEHKNYVADEIEEGVDGTKILTFSMPTNIKESVGVENRQRILVLHEKEGFQEFICYSASIGKKRKKVTAIGSEIELDKLKVVYPATHEGKTLAGYIATGTDGVDWEVGNVKSGVLKTMTIETYLGGFEFLKRIANAFGVELVFRVEHDGHNVIGRYVDAVEKIGSKSGKEFVNAKDILEIRKEVHTERYITALLVIRPDDADGNKRDPILITDDEAFQRWNRNGQHLYGIHNIESTNDEMTDEDARQYGRTELNKRIASVVDYFIDAVDLSSVFPHEVAYLGDEVGIIDEEFNPPLYASARIINIKRPIKKPEEERPVKKTYQIGEVVVYDQDDIAKRLSDMQLNFQRLIKEAERKAQEAADLAGDITNSDNFINALNKKADTSALGDLVSKEELDAMDEEVAARIAEAIRNIDLSDFATKEDLTDAEEKIEKEIIDSTSYNLIKNSIGFGGMFGWNTNGPDHEITTLSNDSLKNLNFGSGFLFVSGVATNGNKILEQTIILEANKTHTISWYLEKTIAGEFIIELLNGEDVFLTIPDFSDPTYPFRSSYVTFTPTSSRVTLRFTAAESTEATLTGLMLTPGETPKLWSLSKGELYNAYVRTDENGITILRLDASGNVIGYSNITPEEFAIYYDELGGNNPERMFWFNKDKTVTRKLEAIEQITMGTLKAVKVDSPSHKGWSFVSNAEDPET